MKIEECMNGNRQTKQKLATFITKTGVLKVNVEKTLCSTDMAMLNIDRRQILHIMVPDTVQELGNYVFWGCANLRTVTLPLGLKKVGYGVFDECDSLEAEPLPYIRAKMDS